MEEETLKISDELLDNLSVEELVKLKFEVDDLLNKTNTILNECDKILDESIII